jgi:hypothetical protein
MLDRITGKPVHAYIQFIGCLGIAAGMPWSKVPLSLSVVLLALNFLLRGDFADVYANLKRKKVFLFFLGFVAIELLSILWSQNKAQALSDLNVRAPFYALPILIAAKPLSNRKQIHWIGFTFIMACFVTSFINIGYYQQWWGNKVYDDFRGLSLFVSHIRYGLIIVLATVFCLAWFMYKLPYRWLAVPLMLWFTFYTYFAQIISGYLAFAACAFVIAVLYLFSIKRVAIRWGISAVFTTIAVIFCVWIYNSVQPEPHKVKIEDLPSHTVNGNLYCQTVSDFWENGNPVYGWYCPQELTVAWNRRSKVDYDTGITPNGEHVYNVLIRYMTSKGIPKDSLGMTKMSEEDIRNVEKGISSIRALEGGLKARLYTISFQLQDRTDPNGHSLLERLEYWRAARAIMSQNWLIGVGMGDVQDEFDAFYEKDHSALHPENRHRAHQMYFTVIISAGIFAFILFLLWWFAQITVAWRLKSLSWLCFIAIAMTSFLIEDTLETQLGGMFVSFFFGLFIAHPRWFLDKSKP